MVAPASNRPSPAPRASARSRISYDDVPIDLHRAFVFPNHLRELRRAKGYAKLLPLAASVPEIPYIRLSKIERGEVVARAEELRRIAAALDVDPAALLIDVDAPGFDIAEWAEPLLEGRAPDLTEERFAVLLAAALRARRTLDPGLSIAVLERDYGLPPVNLSRIENAQKPIARWNPVTLSALFRIFDVSSEGELRAAVIGSFENGALTPYLENLGNPAVRHERTRLRIAELAAALADSPAAPPAALPVVVTGVRRLPVLGVPLPAGLIADTPTGEEIDAPRGASPAAFGLKSCRATLGGGLPAQATVVVDPARFPVAGGLAAVHEGNTWRLLAVEARRDGRLLGYAVNPEYEIVLDDLDPSNVAAVIGASFL